MNTAKQINVMIGLLFVGLVGTCSTSSSTTGSTSPASTSRAARQSPAQRQEFTNAERGGFLYARNCRSCHGLTGQGAIERPGLPGAPLNDARQPPAGAAGLRY